MSDLTVKITLSSVSPNRPKQFPGSRTKYPFSDLLVKTQRSGTGKLLRVTLHPRSDQLKCKCQLCRDSNEPCEVWGEITVRTSTHVVFDTSECETAKLHVFYDEQNQDTQTLESLDGVQVNYAGVDTDWCNLTCASHNMKLLLYLKYLEEEYLEVHKRIRDKYFNSEQQLVVVVSHPHGWSKLISIGRWTARKELDGIDTKYEYTSSTCPGSSGAPVFILGRGWWSNNLPHSGSRGGRNFSGVDMK